MDHGIAPKDPAWVALRAASELAWDEKIARLGPSALPNPLRNAERGQRIYDERYKTEYEKLYTGQFVAINVETEKPFFGSTPWEAFRHGLEDSLTACLFVVKVGSPAAWEFRARGSYARRYRHV